MCPTDKGNPNKPRKRLRHDAISQPCCFFTTDSSASDAVVPDVEFLDTDYHFAEVNVFEVTDTEIAHDALSD